MSNTLLLALDTSTEYCSVALAVFPSRAFFSGLPGVTSPFRVFGLANLFIRHENTDIVSSERLLPMVREVFDEARRDLSDCAAIAFGAGPGAFTGIRTAAGAAQGLAFALQIPMIPVNTLLACAQAAHMHRSAATRVLAALDARMDEVYWGGLEWEEARANWGTVQAATVGAPEQAGQRAFSRLRAMRPQYLARGWRRERVPHRLTRARCRTPPRSPVWVGNACAQDMPYRRWMRSRNMYATALRSRPWNASQNFD